MSNMNRGIQPPLVDTTCLCRVDAGLKTVAGAKKFVPGSKLCLQPDIKPSIHPTRQKPSRGDRSRSQSPLIPGLPDDLAIACLIRVPRIEHRKLRLVCNRWYRLLAGNFYYSLRKNLGIAEEWIYIMKRDKDGKIAWHAFDPIHQLWQPLPPVPKEYSGALGFGCAVLSGCHLYLFGGKDPVKGSMRRVIFYSARTNKWHRARDMLRRRHFFGCCVINNCLYVAGGENEGVHRSLRSAEIYDPHKNRWSFISDMSTAMVPFIGVVYEGKWFLKGLGSHRQVLSEVYQPATDNWDPVYDGMVAGWRNPSTSLNGKLYALECKDGCKLRVYDEATDSWSKHIDSKMHIGNSKALEAAALVPLNGKLCIIRNNMSISMVDVSKSGDAAAAATAEHLWETIAGKDIPVEASGSNIPPAVHTFAEIRLGKALDDNISRCNYVKPTPIQRHAIPVALAGRDLMACAQTGSGKTAAFCFPIISGILNLNAPVVVGRRLRVASPLALILAPTRELCSQIHEEAKKFSYQTGVKVVVAYGGAPIQRQLQNLEKGVDILVATPGRLVDMIERERVSLRRIKYLALDEADRMLDMGFERQIREIVEQMGMPSPGARQTLLFSATFPTEIQRLASDFLSNYIFLTVGRVGSSTDLIDQRVELVQDMDKRRQLMNLLKDQRSNGMANKLALTLVFVETKRGADALEQWLCRNGFPATAIHGDKVQMERERALRSFKNGTTPIMVATDVAARGLDVPNVTHVINFDLPRDIDDYVHRIGRTGRAGKSGVATAFFNEKNSPIAKALAQLMEEANQQVPSFLAQFANSSLSYGGGRSHRGRSKFGGHDFRNSWNNGGGGRGSGNNDYYASTDQVAYNEPYNAGTYNATAYSGSTYADYSRNEFVADGNVNAYKNGAPSYESKIVPTGWD